MKSIVSPKPNNLLTSNKRTTPDYSDMERNNIYAETPPKSKATLVNGTNHYMPVLQQRRAPKVLIRHDLTQSMHDGTSTSSMSSFSTATCSSQSTTPSTSFRQDTTSIMTRSADASSAAGLINQTNQTKSKSTYDIDTVTTDRSRQPMKENLNQNNNNNNSKCSNTITNGNFVPLQSVKEDECLEVEPDRTIRCFQVSIVVFFFDEQFHAGRTEEG